MSKQLTIVFMPNEGVGHMNGCIGFAQCLKARGHRIVFIIDKVWATKIKSKYDFEEEVLLMERKINYEQPAEYLANSLIRLGLLSNRSEFDKMKSIVHNFTEDRMGLKDTILENESFFKAIDDKYNPDVYVIETLIGPPIILNSGKPWVYIITTTPIYLYHDDRTPPTMSGFPANGDRNKWKEFSQHLKPMLRSSETNKKIQSMGYPGLVDDFLLPFSPYLNVYAYPEELDYTDIRPMPENWMRIDIPLRTGEQEFEIPEKLTQNIEKSAKIIFLSMGSMGSIDVELMKRLVKILSKSKHKFIVSKGLLGDKYELPDNMWGENSVPQTKVLPLVDLVITHGGNNTVYETFTFGKPMIVLPLFGDQYDNAQRIHEKGFGVRLNPYECSEEELLNAIENVLNDKELKQRLSVASKRILNSNSLTKASEIIEKISKTDSK